MADKRIGGNEKINSRMLLFDEMTMAQMMAGFPGLIGIPYQLIPVFLVSELDQLICIPYIDAGRELRPARRHLPGADQREPAAPLSTPCLTAASALSPLPPPCDGSDMATSFQERRLKKLGLPTYPLTLPVRYDDEDTVECGAQDMWHCIKWG